MTIGTRDSGFGIHETGFGRRVRRAAFLVSGCVTLLSMALPVFAAGPQPVTFAARDGAQISGVLHLPERHPAPGVVLLPMLGRTHRDWDQTAARLAAAGIAALAIDFRHLGAALPDGSAAPEGGYRAFVLDADAARAYLAARPEIDPAKIGMAGGSLGANVAVLSAGADASVRSLALLSVSGDYRGLKMEQALTSFGSRPALLVASSEDVYALRSARQAVTMGGGARELRVMAGAGHGLVMLAREPDLASVLVDWFLRTLL